MAFPDLLTFAAALWDMLAHLDKHLAALVGTYGTWIYAILFAIVFCETGLVVMPFLPGDSLLFVAGALAALGGMDINLLMPTLIVAALCGDNVNYWIGHFVGPKVFSGDGSRMLNRKALEKTHAFYETHGGKTVIIARFLPLVRTFAPFVAGIGRMSYVRFLAFSIVGALLWVVGLCMLGYWFGNLPVVKNNLTIVILGIIGLSLMPMVIGAVRSRTA